MTYEKKSKKLLFIATALTTVALVSVGVTFAAISATFHGQEVTVNDVVQGSVKYSIDETNWGTTIPTFDQGTGQWFARFDVSSATYSGTATVTFALEKSTDGGASYPTTVTTFAVTGFTLTGSSIIYATNNGLATGTYHNFSDDISAGGTYRISVTVASG